MKGFVMLLGHLSEFLIWFVKEKSATNALIKIQ